MSLYDLDGDLNLIDGVLDLLLGVSRAVGNCYFASCRPSGGASEQPKGVHAQLVAVGQHMLWGWPP